MRVFIAASGILLLICACTATQPAREPNLGPEKCTGANPDWEEERREILHLNPGYSIHLIEEREAFVEAFNALPPKTKRPVPDLIGYFSKPGDDQAILAFIGKGCVTYLEVVSHGRLKEIMPKAQ